MKKINWKGVLALALLGLLLPLWLPIMLVRLAWYTAGGACEDLLRWFTD